MGKLPSEIEGEFGPGVKSLIYTLKHVANVSEPKMEEFIDNFRIFNLGRILLCYDWHNGI